MHDEGSGIRVPDFEFRVSGTVYRVQGRYLSWPVRALALDPVTPRATQIGPSIFVVRINNCSVQRLDIDRSFRRIQGSGFRVQGSGFRV